MFGGNFAVGVVFFVPRSFMAGCSGFRWVLFAAWFWWVCSYWLLLDALILAVVGVVGVVSRSGWGDGILMCWFACGFLGCLCVVFVWVVVCFVVCLVVATPILVVYGVVGFALLVWYTFVFWIGGFCGWVGVLGRL